MADQQHVSPRPRHRLASFCSRQQQLQHHVQRRLLHVTCAAETQTAEASSGTGDEFYEVFINKPLGIRFDRGRDGSAYVVRSDASLGNVDPQVEVGDKLVQVSASFGSDVWDAGKFGQTMYAIKTRNGELYFKFKRNYGNMAAFEEEEMSEAEKTFKRERAGGNYGGGTKEVQMANFRSRKEKEAKRKELFDEGLRKFGKNDIKGALFDFEEVIALEPKNVVGDDFSKVTPLYRVSQYNIACCYSAIKEIDAGLEALEVALSAGFEQYGKVRTDPNLENLRKSPKFTTLIDRFDEPVVNPNLFKAFGGLFGGKK